MADDVALSYSSFISLVNSKNLLLQYTDLGDKYYLFAFELSSSWGTLVYKDGGQNQVDFETNYEPTANAPIFGQKIMAKSIPVVLSSDQTAIPVSSSPSQNTFFSFGDITTTATTQTAVTRTTYTEQASNAQRSIKSSSANDTSAGTGARTVIITYYDQTGAGPNTETVTLNGTTAVNTVGTNIAFIEKILVKTVGSTGSNVGIITLNASVGGAGTVIGTINPTDNQTFWCHHYIPTGKTCFVTGMSCGHNGTTVGSGGLFILKSLPVNLANAVEVQVSDFVRLYGQSSTFARVYTSSIRIVGPARLNMYATPETASSTSYKAAFDFFEQ